MSSTAKSIFHEPISLIISSIRTRDQNRVVKQLLKCRSLRAVCVTAICTKISSTCFDSDSNNRVFLHSCMCVCHTKRTPFVSWHHTAFCTLEEFSSWSEMIGIARIAIVRMCQMFSTVRLLVLIRVYV